MCLGGTEGRLQAHAASTQRDRTGVRVGRRLAFRRRSRVDGCLQPALQPARAVADDGAGGEIRRQVSPRRTHACACRRRGDGHRLHAEHAEPLSAPGSFRPPSASRADHLRRDGAGSRRHSGARERHRFPHRAMLRQGLRCRHRIHQRAGQSGRALLRARHRTAGIPRRTGRAGHRVAAHAAALHEPQRAGLQRRRCDEPAAAGQGGNGRVVGQPRVAHGRRPSLQGGGQDELRRSARGARRCAQRCALVVGRRGDAAPWRRAARGRLPGADGSAG